MVDQPQPFAGLDAGKLTDVIASVWDHKDEVGDAVSFVREHGDDLLALAARLPELLASASKALGEAATDTRATAHFLTGDDTRSGVKHLAVVAADALDVCQAELGKVRGLLAAAADAMTDVPLVGPSARKITDGVSHFDAVGDQLAEVARSLRGIGDAVDRAGTALGRTADKLEGGGRALSSFDGR